MSEQFKLEIISPEKSFFLNDNVTEAIIPGYEGEMGILKDHISIISFLKPGIIKIFSNSNEEKYYVDDGIIEFKNNNLSVLTSYILDIKNIDKDKIDFLLKDAENKLKNDKISDQNRYLVDQKIEILRSFN